MRLPQLEQLLNEDARSSSSKGTVMQIANVLAGTRSVEADLLRRATARRILKNGRTAPAAFVKRRSRTQLPRKEKSSKLIS